MMKEMFCQACGNKLSTVRSLNQHYATYFKCTKCRSAFLHVWDMRNIYHLCMIHSRKAQKVLEYASPQELENAFKALVRVDSYSLATENFENHLSNLWFKDITNRSLPEP